ncbi:nuclear transport factor 2 family protein [Temperatibacter marinus]|uniref:Nuclear transport factor 2 family protein n=1 Tax=Temperatibacter marinus TaxID=1456591 RepID=A0AA52EK53_9PROT|nr:nuclear transport factor 2 family protein [Temperatibacter marinus]WND03964.1 nuclear transport factor 2 family protein [Temperatibacter marinus]
MSTHENLPEVIRKFITSYNEKDVDAMMSCLHREAEFENISNYFAAMNWKGHDSIRALAESSAAAFASRKQTVLMAVVEGDKVALQVEFAGVPLVDLPNGMKAGEATILRGASFFTLKDDKIISLSDMS